MPKTVKFSGVMESAYGKKLDTPIPFEGTFEALQKGEEIPAKEAPDAEDLLNIANNKRKAKERQKAMNAALKANGIEAPVLGVDVEFTFREMVKMLVASKVPQDTAVQMANANLAQTPGYAGPYTY